MESQLNKERLDLLVLSWLWCQRGKPAAEGAPVKGVKPLLPPAVAVQGVLAALDRLVQAGHVERIAPATKKGKPTFRLSESGERRVAESLGRSEPPAGKTPFATVAGVLLPSIALQLASP